MEALKDYLRLTKPSITRLCLVATGAGLWLARDRLTLGTALAALVGTALAVASANAFNMWWEREADGRMERTRDRPLPAGRLQPGAALRFAAALALGSMLVLGLLTNPLTLALGALSLVAYVVVYTPLKYHTPLALWVGAVPGAMPPLMGYTAVTGEIGSPGLALFAIVLVWQLPHFLAIALFRGADYAKAGVRTLVQVHGERAARVQMIAWTTVLLPAGLLPAWLGLAGSLYLTIALAAGAALLLWSLLGLRQVSVERWARGFFFATLAYLPAILVALVLDSVAG
jgi:protoheme IX farnesyltransferase